MCKINEEMHKMITDFIMIEFKLNSSQNSVDDNVIDDTMDDYEIVL